MDHNNINPFLLKPKLHNLIVAHKILENILTDRCEQTHLDGWTRQNDTIYIGWKQPQDGWFKLICDGAHKSSLNLSGCGGLLRNSYGICVSSFARKIGSCDALHAEMWGMYIGMDLARRQGITHLQVESDSKVLVDMVTGNCKVDQTHSRSQDLGLASPD
jgi:hypothetical protein